MAVIKGTEQWLCASLYLWGSYGNIITMLKDNQGLEGLVTLPRAGNLCVRGGKRIKPKPSDFSACCWRCEKMLVDWLCKSPTSLNTYWREEIKSKCGDGLDRQAAGKQRIITAIKTMQRVISVLRSVQPDGKRSSSLVLSDSRGCGQRGRHGWVIFDWLSLMCVASVTPISDACDLFYYTVRIKTP